MDQSLGLIAPVVRDYDEALAFFLCTDDFWRDHARYSAQGVEFLRGPSEQPHGTVAVFEDLYGDLRDFVQLTGGRRSP